MHAELEGRLTQTDIRTSVTLIRIASVDHSLFKTNHHQSADYPRLPGVAWTVYLEHIRAGDRLIEALNPTSIIPAGPDHVTALLKAAS